MYIYIHESPGTVKYKTSRQSVDPLDQLLLHHTVEGDVGQVWDEGIARPSADTCAATEVEQGQVGEPLQVRQTAVRQLAAACGRRQGETEQEPIVTWQEKKSQSSLVEGCKHRANHSPASVSSVRLCRVWVPAAHSRATAESAMPLQCARSRRSSCGRWRCSKRRVASPTSRPERRSVVRFLSRLRDDSKPAGGDIKVVESSSIAQINQILIVEGLAPFKTWCRCKYT